MPIYEFECKKCGYRFEKLCSISSGTDGIDCPDCRSGEVGRLMSMFSSRVSGSCDGGGSSCSCGGNCGGNCGNCSGGCHH